jgi:hypothetical protein
MSSALNPTAAQQIGMQEEGTAVVAEYVAAVQLGLPMVYSQGGPGIQPDKSITAKLAADAAIDLVTSVLASTQIGNLTQPSEDMATFIQSGTTDGGTLYATRHPSTSPGITYSQLWVDEWLTNYMGYSSLVGYAADGQQFQEQGNSVSGSSWSGNNITLTGGTATDLFSGNTPVVAGETLSFSGTETPSGTIAPGPITLALGGSATITGGAGSNDYYCRAGTNSIIINFSIPGFIDTDETDRIVANPQGLGSLTLETIHPGPVNIVVGSSSTPITPTGFMQWTDGTESFQFIPGTSSNLVA